MADDEEKLMWGLIKFLFNSVLLLGLNATFIVALALSVVYQKLPQLDILADYRPRLPMRIYTSEGNLMGIFGKEKRLYRKFQEFPPSLIEALLATEDVRFFEHQGIDIIGVMRAALGYIKGRREGASTITMQVARNFYLTRERTLLRKVTEALLALEIERRFSKREILELYMNQIYLGRGSFGFGAAAQAYYDKTLSELSLAEIAFLAGLPKAPSNYNPQRFPARAKARQTHVLGRMYAAGIIDQTSYETIVAAKLPGLQQNARRFDVIAPFVAEEVRQIVFAHFGETAYERGLNIYTTIQTPLQNAAVRAVRQGLLAHQLRRPYIGPEKFIDINGLSKKEIIARLAKEKTIGGAIPAVIIDANKKSLAVIGKNGSSYRILRKQMATSLRRHLPGGGKKPELTVGALTRIQVEGELASLVVLPGAEAALVAVSPEDGAVLAMAGGFDFNTNQFNHATQARRQLGSSIKPFIYSAAIEKGFTPASILTDTPIFLSAAETGSNNAWEPKNYDGKTSGRILLRQALAKSKNLASVHLLKFIGVKYAQDYLTRFGFRRQDHPPYLTMGLGAGVTTPMEVALAYSVFANGGYQVKNYLISRVEDYDGNLIINELDFKNRRRAIDARNAYIITSLLQSVVKEGTGRSALRTVNRNDLAGKTGTTNDTRDAWFAGFGGNVVAVAWIGYDQLKSLGKKETGGRAALPIWSGFMASALKNTPEVEYLPAPGIVIANIDKNGYLLSSEDDSQTGRQEYFYQEYLPPAKPAFSTQETEELF